MSSTGTFSSFLEEQHQVFFPHSCSKPRVRTDTNKKTRRGCLLPLRIFKSYWGDMFCCPKPVLVLGRMKGRVSTEGSEEAGHLQSGWNCIPAPGVGSAGCRKRSQQAGLIKLYLKGKKSNSDYPYHTQQISKRDGGSLSKCHAAVGEKS